MFKNCAFITLMLLGTLAVQGQKIPVKFGKVDDEDLKMEEYAPDPDADAVILADYGETRFVYDQQSGWQVILERVKRVKILTQAGLEYADQSIPYYDNGKGFEERVSSLRGYTHNLINGKAERIKLTNDAEFDEQTSENWHLKKFTMPDVQVGSVIEWKYTFTSDDFRHLYTWYFQDEIPTLHSEFRYVIPEFFKYQPSMTGSHVMSVNENSSITESYRIRYEYTEPGGTITVDYMNLESNSTKYRLVAENVPAITREPYMTAFMDYATKIPFELSLIHYKGTMPKYQLGTYPQMAKKLLDIEDFSNAMKPVNAIQKEVEPIVAGTQEPLKKAVLVYDNLIKRVNWNNKYGWFPRQNAKKTLSGEEATVADINFALIAMLRSAGIEAGPVLVSTRNNGKPHPMYPNSNKFNYVLAYAKIGDKGILLDGTSPNLPLGMLPVRCLNGQGYLIAENPGWIPLKSRGFFESNTQTTLAFNESGELVGELTQTGKDYVGYEMRMNYHSEGEEEYVASLKSDIDNYDLSDISFEHTSDIYEPFTQRVQLTYSDAAMLDQPVIYLNPMQFGGIKENPFKLENRAFPVEMPAAPRDKIMFEIEIPEGYTVEVPESAIYQLPDRAAVFQYSANQFGSKVAISSMVIFNEDFFTPEEYQSLKEFYDLIIAKHQEQIVLKKTT